MHPILFKSPPLQPNGRPRTSTTKADSVIPPRAYRLCLAEVVRRAFDIDELAGGNSVSVDSYDLRSVDMELMIEDVVASLKRIQVPVNVLGEHDWGLRGRCGVDRGFRNATIFDCMRCLSKKKRIRVTVFANRHGRLQKQ